MSACFKKRLGPCLGFLTLSVAGGALRPFLDRVAKPWPHPIARLTPEKLPGDTTNAALPVVIVLCGSPGQPRLLERRASADTRYESRLGGLSRFLSADSFRCWAASRRIMLSHCPLCVMSISCHVMFPVLSRCRSGLPRDWKRAVCPRVFGSLYVEATVGVVSGRCHMLVPLGQMLQWPLPDLPTAIHGGGR